MQTKARSMFVLLVIFVLSYTAVGFSYNSNGYGSNEYANTGGTNTINSDKKDGQCGCFAGAPGPPGIPGVPGMHGHRGVDGKDGTRGERGEPGMTGFKGEHGVIGPLGPTGARGRKGMAGPAGPKGDKGADGLDGKPGLPGIPGAKGMRGEMSKPPRHIAFSVVRSTKLGPVLQDTPITFDRVVTNVGGGFDEYSSHFVCRINGTYMFITHILGQNNKDVYAWIMLNNKHKVPLHGDGRAGYGTGSQSIIINLKFDDHVWVQLSKDSGLLNDYSTFSGYLLFEEQP